MRSTTVLDIMEACRGAPAHPPSSASAVERDPRVRAVLEHFEEWHGGGPNAVEASILLERIDASSPAQIRDAERFRWLIANLDRLGESAGSILPCPASRLRAAIDTAMHAMP